MIAAAHHISIRHLYKLFQEQGVSTAPKGTGMN